MWTVKEVLTPVEARLLAVSKDAADRLHREADTLLNESLTTIILAHGMKPDDAKYDFEKDGADYYLRVSPK